MEDLKLATDHSERLHNEDLAPVEERTWSTYSLFAMWMSDVHSIGEYTMAAGLFFLGLNGWQVFLALIIGITIVYFLMNLTGIAGQQYGIPYSGVSRLNAPNKTVVLTPADQGTPEIEETPGGCRLAARNAPLGLDSDSTKTRCLHHPPARLGQRRSRGQAPLVRGLDPRLHARGGGACSKLGF